MQEDKDGKPERIRAFLKWKAAADAGENPTEAKKGTKGDPDNTEKGGMDHKTFQAMIDKATGKIKDETAAIDNTENGGAKAPTKNTALPTKALPDIMITGGVKKGVAKDLKIDYPTNATSLTKLQEFLLRHNGNIAVSNPQAACKRYDADVKSTERDKSKLVKAYIAALFSDDE